MSVLCATEFVQPQSMHDGGEKKEGSRRERQRPESRGGEEGGETGEERSGGQAVPANQRRAPELQKTEPRSPGLAGAPSRVWGSPRTGAAVP